MALAGPRSGLGTGLRAQPSSRPGLQARSPLAGQAWSRGRGRVSPRKSPGESAQLPEGREGPLRRQQCVPRCGAGTVTLGRPAHFWCGGQCLTGTAGGCVWRPDIGCSLLGPRGGQAPNQAQCAGVYTQSHTRVPSQSPQPPSQSHWGTGGWRPPPWASWGRGPERGLAGWELRPAQGRGAHAASAQTQGGTHPSRVMAFAFPTQPPTRPAARQEGAWPSADTGPSLRAAWVAELCSRWPPRLERDPLGEPPSLQAQGPRSQLGGRLLRPASQSALPTVLPRAVLPGPQPRLRHLHVAGRLPFHRHVLPQPPGRLRHHVHEGAALPGEWAVRAGRGRQSVGPGQKDV